ncbi:MAG: hypothetical protein M0R51_11815 [Clostridia bacterium]|jgi:hypothetical protein|nr:hypothetical protein [Clostridia bacterium]
MLAERKKRQFNLTIFEDKIPDFMESLEVAIVTVPRENRSMLVGFQKIMKEALAKKEPETYFGFRAPERFNY